MGSRIAQGDTAARERIAIASALMSAVPPARRAGRPDFVRGQREDWEARRAGTGTWEWRRVDLPFLVASETRLLNSLTRKSEKRVGKLLLETRKPWSMLGCVVCYLSPSLAGWGLTQPSHMFTPRQNRTCRRQLHRQHRPHSCCYPCLRRHHPFGCFPRHLHGCH